MNLSNKCHVMFFIQKRPSWLMGYWRALPLSRLLSANLLVKSWAPFRLRLSQYVFEVVISDVSFAQSSFKIKLGNYIDFFLWGLIKVLLFRLCPLLLRLASRSVPLSWVAWLSFFCNNFFKSLTKRLPFVWLCKAGSVFYRLVLMVLESFFESL
jgi:hypothetical protein